MFGILIMAIFTILVTKNEISKGGVSSLIEKSKTIVRDAEAARNEMAKKLTLNVIKEFDNIPDASILEAVPVITAINIAKKNAANGNYEFRVPKVSPRNPNNTPTPEEKEVLDHLKKTNSDEYIIKTKNHIKYFKAIRLTPDCLLCHGDPKGTLDPVGGIKEGWKSGEIHGAFEIISSMDETKAKIKTATIRGVFITFLILIPLIIITLWTSFTITKPLKQSVEFAGLVEKGDLTATIILDQKDEIGTLGNSLNSMTSGLRNIISNISNLAVELNTQSENLAKVSQKMHQTSEETDLKSSSVAAASEEMSVNMASVSAAAEQSNANLKTIATSSEEMAATVNEIATSSEKARDISQQAVNSVKSSLDGVSELEQSTQEITDVLDLIFEIATQTRLLALNATVEAARAGDAGKGFAVVANEVKNLALQTNKATEEIGQKIKMMQNSTGKTINDIKLINKNILNVDEIITSIAAAVEEQSVVTREIFRNIAEAVEGNKEVTVNVTEASTAAANVTSDISEVSIKSDEVKRASESLQANALKLNSIGKDLIRMVKKFTL